MAAPKGGTPWKWLARLAIGFVVLGLLLAQRKTAAEVQHTFRQVPLWVMAGSVLAYWAGQMLSAWRWQILLKTRGIPVPFLVCCRIYLAGMFGNLFLPTSIGGDVLRTYLLTRAAKTDVPNATASVLMDRVTGFVALLLITVVGTLYSGARQQAMPVLIMGFVILGVFVGLLFVARRLSGREAPTGFLGKVHRIWSALSYYLEKDHRLGLLAAIGISIVFQSSQILLNIGLARAAGIHVVPFAAFFWLVPLMNLSAMIPLSIGGLGVRETFVVALLHGAGYEVPKGMAIAWSLLWQATGWLASLPGALVVRMKDKEV
jgi:hypothetical protein